MKTSYKTALGVLLMACAPWVSADDIAAGKANYSACISCHGENGQGDISQRAPRLTHLTPVYIAAQLKKFKTGMRGGENSSRESAQMAAMAATLPDDQAIADVAAYIDTLQSGPPKATIEGDAAAGADHYNQFCGACHGASAQGNPALNSPRLAGADDWYLVAQLSAFRTGNRGAHPQDRTGRQMRAMAGLLGDEKTVRDVVAFIRNSAAP